MKEDNLLEGIEFFEELTQLSLRQLFGLQRWIGHAIEEKINELDNRTRGLKEFNI